MFRKKSEHRRRGSNPIVAFFRFLISLCIFLLLFGGVYYAYREFSGFDPLKMSPQSIKEQLFSKEKLADFGYSLLSFDFKKALQGLNSQSKSDPKIIPDDSNSASVQQKPSPKPTILFKFSLVADSENDNDLLFKALTQAKDNGASFAIGLGDYTDVGTINELQQAKNQFDKAGLRYYTIPGDHDLWDSRNKNQPALTNYKAVFGIAYTSFDFENIHFLLADNSDSYEGFNNEEMSFIQNDLSNLKFKNSDLNLAFFSTPLYHPSSDHFMGDVTPKLKTQATQMAQNLKSNNFRAVFAGDIHYFTQYSEPATSLSMTTVGAVNQARNIEAPRYAVVSILSDKTIKVDDIEIKQ